MHRIFVVAALFSIPALSACGGQSGNVGPSSYERVPNATVRHAVEEACAIHTLRLFGGKLTLATYGGYDGEVSYGSNDAPNGQRVRLCTSTSNVDRVPPPKNGTPVVFVDISEYFGSSDIRFRMASEKSKIASVNLDPASAYALYLYRDKHLESGYPVSLKVEGAGPVYDVKFTSPLDGHTLRYLHEFVIELVKE